MIDNSREAFEAWFPLAVWDWRAGGYTDSMYSYAFAGFRAGRASATLQDLADIGQAQQPECYADLTRPNDVYKFRTETNMTDQEGK